MVNLNYSVVIRKATESDAYAIKDILSEAFRLYVIEAGINQLDALTESIEEIKKDIMAKEVFIAFINDTPVGTVRVELFGNGEAYFSRFGVLCNYHNVGTGKAIMNLVDEFLVTKGVQKLSLHTASKNRELVRFYYARGFYIQETALDRGYVRALMVKEYK